MAESKKRQRPKTRLSLHAFTRRSLIASVIFIALLALATFVWYSIYVLLLIFAGVLLAIMLRALADVVSDRAGLSHRWSLAIVLSVLAIIFSAGIYIAAPSLIHELNQLADRLPQAIEMQRQRMEQSEIGRLLLRQSPQVSALMSARTDLLGSVTGFVSTTIGGVVSLMVVLFTGLYLAFDPTLYVRGALRLLPMRHRERGGEVLGAIGYTLKWWLIGQAIAMLIIGVATTAGLWLLGVPLAFVLGIMAALLNFIPNFGPLIALIPAALLALGIDGGGQLALYVVLYVVLQNVEGYLLTPMIQRSVVLLPPALTIITQVLLGILVGPLGLVMATPLAAAVLVAIKMLYVEDALGDKVPTPADNPNLPEVKEALKQAEEVTSKK